LKQWNMELRTRNPELRTKNKEQRTKTPEPLHAIQNAER
jgi:hypothetical protein